MFDMSLYCLYIYCEYYTAGWENYAKEKLDEECIWFHVLYYYILLI